MTKYILVLKSDEDPKLWKAVAVADTRAALDALPCYKQQLILSKADYPGILDGPIRTANCATPNVFEDGNVYRVTGP